MEARVQWLVADVTTAELPVHAFDVWHDRAVFHFLTTFSPDVIAITPDANAYLDFVLAIIPGLLKLGGGFHDQGLRLPDLVFHSL